MRRDEALAEATQIARRCESVARTWTFIHAEKNFSAGLILRTSSLVGYYFSDRAAIETSRLFITRDLVLPGGEVIHECERL